MTRSQRVKVSAMTPLVLVVALAAGPPRSLPLLKPASPTALVALRMRGGAADQEIKPSGVDAMRNTLVVVRRVVRRSAVLAVVIIHLLYVKPLYRQWFKDLFALWDRHHFTVLLVLLLL